MGDEADATNVGQVEVMAAVPDADPAVDAPADVQGASDDAHMQAVAEHVSNKVSGVEVTVVGSAVQPGPRPIMHAASKRAPSRPPVKPSSMPTYSDEQETSTTMGFLLSTEDRLLEHKRLVRTRARDEQLAAQAELEEKLRLRRERFGPMRAGSPLVRAASSLGEPLGGPATSPSTNASDAGNTQQEATSQQQRKQQPHSDVSHDTATPGSAGSAGGSGEPSAAELAGPYVDHPGTVGGAHDHDPAHERTGAWHGWNVVDMPSVREQGDDDSDVEIIGVPIMN